jgi:hypothetical protein
VSRLKRLAGSGGNYYRIRVGDYGWGWLSRMTWQSSCGVLTEKKYTDSSRKHLNERI